MIFGKIHTWTIENHRYECVICGIRKSIPYKEKSNFERYVN